MTKHYVCQSLSDVQQSTLRQTSRESEPWACLQPSTCLQPHPWSRTLTPPQINQNQLYFCFLRPMSWVLCVYYFELAFPPPQILPSSMLPINKLQEININSHLLWWHDYIFSMIEAVSTGCHMCGRHLWVYGVEWAHLRPIGRPPPTMLFKSTPPTDF